VPHFSDPSSIQDTGRFPHSIKPECELNPKNDIKEDEGLHVSRLIQGPGSKLTLKNQLSISPHAGADLIPKPIPLQCTDEVPCLNKILGPVYNITSSAKANVNSRITAGIVPTNSREVTPSVLAAQYSRDTLANFNIAYIPFGPTEPLELQICSC
jgi:hypothetical protein